MNSLKTLLTLLLACLIVAGFVGWLDESSPRAVPGVESVGGL